MTVAQLTETLTAAEEQHWLSLYVSDPWGEQRGDLRNALLAQLIHATHSKHPKQLGDFMLFKGKKETQPDGDISSTIRTNFERLIERQR